MYSHVESIMGMTSAYVHHRRRRTFRFSRTARQSTNLGVLHHSFRHYECNNNNKCTSCLSSLAN